MGHIKIAIALSVLTLAGCGLAAYACKMGQLVTCLSVSMFAVTLLLAVSTAMQKFFGATMFWSVMSISSLIIIPVALQEKNLRGSDSSLTLNRVYRYYCPLPLASAASCNKRVNRQSVISAPKKVRRAQPISRTVRSTQACV